MPAHVERLPDGTVRFSRTHPTAQLGCPVARLVFTRQEWVDFLLGVKAGEFDLNGAVSDPGPLAGPVTPDAGEQRSDAAQCVSAGHAAATPTTTGGTDA